MPLTRSKLRPLRHWAVAYWPLLIPLLLFLPGLTGFPYPSAQAPYSDLTISHYPNAVFLRSALAKWGRVPLWSPTILSGHPFAANPLSGLWYPPGWLALLLPLPLGFNLLVMLHLLLGGLGVIRFLRLEGLSRRAALLGGMAFAALPKLFAHYGAGHLTLLYAVPWTPWLLVASFCGKRRTSVECCEADFAEPCIETRERVPISGLILALIFLADPRWAPFAGLLWWGYDFAHSQFWGEGRRRWRGLAISLACLVIQSLIAILLAGPLLLPLMEQVGLATRAQLTRADVFSHSLPPARLLGLLFPDFGGAHEWMLYPGAAVLILAIAALFGRRREPKRWFWLGVFCLAILFSLGSHLPGLSILARLPGVSLLRVPSRALFLAGLAAAVLAAYGLQTLDESRVSAHATLVWMALSGFGLSLAVGVRVVTGAWAWEFVWGAGALLAVSLWGLARLHGRLPAASGYVILVGLAVLDWGLVNASVVSFRPKEIVLSQGEEVAQYLADQPGRFRIYSPSYSLPQHTTARYGLELADGVDPLQLRAYADFMDATTGVPREGYSVTLPPFAEGEPSEDNAAYRPVPGLLGLLNVRYVAAEFDLPVEGLVLREQFGETRLYENWLALPRAWVQSEKGVFEERAELLTWQPNRIVVRAEGPGTLALSEMAYPGWRVRVDGEAAEMEPVKELLRGVELPAGEHRVVFRFVPLSVYVGLLGWLVGMVAMVWVGRRERQEER